MDLIQRAIDHGMVVLNPSSSTYSIVEALTGQRPQTNTWLCGMIIPKGACVEAGELAGFLFGDRASHSWAGYKNSWVIRNREVTVGTPIAE